MIWYSVIGERTSRLLRYIFALPSRVQLGGGFYCPGRALRGWGVQNIGSIAGAWAPPNILAKCTGQEYNTKQQGSSEGLRGGASLDPT